MAALSGHTCLDQSSYQAQLVRRDSEEEGDDSRTPILTDLTYLVDFAEQIFLPLLYVLRTISRNSKELWFGVFLKKSLSLVIL